MDQSTERKTPVHQSIVHKTKPGIDARASLKEKRNREETKEKSMDKNEMKLTENLGLQVFGA
jgi:hypothetical protein